MTKKNKRCTKFPKKLWGCICKEVKHKNLTNKLINFHFKEMRKLRFHTLALHQNERSTLKTKSARHIDLSHNGYQVGHFGK